MPCYNMGRRRRRRKKVREGPLYLPYILCVRVWSKFFAKKNKMK